MDASRLYPIARRSWRLLRTVAASFALVACLLALALWADSYRNAVLVSTPSIGGASAYSTTVTGETRLGYVYPSHTRAPEDNVLAVMMCERDALGAYSSNERFLGFGYESSKYLCQVTLPIWFLVLIAAALALLLKPNPRFRFSIADLAIFTTVGAVTLGGLAAFYRAYSVG